MAHFNATLKDHLIAARRVVGWRRFYDLAREAGISKRAARNLKSLASWHWSPEFDRFGKLLAAAGYDLEAARAKTQRRVTKRTREWAVRPRRDWLRKRGFRSEGEMKFYEDLAERRQERIAEAAAERRRRFLTGRDGTEWAVLWPGGTVRTCKTAQDAERLYYARRNYRHKPSGIAYRNAETDGEWHFYRRHMPGDAGGNLVDIMTCAGFAGWHTGKRVPVEAA